MERPSYYSRNREKCLAYQHTYNALHKEHRKAYDRARYAKTRVGKVGKDGIVIERNVHVAFDDVPDILRISQGRI